MYIAFLLLGAVLQTSGCITTEQSYEATRNPAYVQEVERELKTDEDWERWNYQQKHNRNATIIIPGH